MDERISKEAKLNATKDIVASYVKGAAVGPEQVCSLFSQLYKTIDETIPDAEKRRVGLGA